MNWLAFAIAGWFFFGLELGLRDLVHLGPRGIAPSFVLAFLVFVALNATQRSTLWAAIALGILTDLTGSIALLPRGTAIIIGPHAIGYLLGAQVVLALRGMVVSRNPLSMGVLSILAGLVASIVVVAFMTIHRLIGDPIIWEPTAELLGALLRAVYTGILATVLAFVLIPLSSVFGFATTHRRFGH